MPSPGKGANVCPNGIDYTRTEHLPTKTRTVLDRNGKPLIGKDGKPVVIRISSSSTIEICKAKPDDKKAAQKDAPKETGSKFTTANPVRDLGALKSKGKPRKLSPEAKAALEDASKFGIISVLDGQKTSAPPREWGKPSKAAGPAKK